ncbi:MAG: hypothetical protein LBI02_00985 [Opitutaceae bacterium]|nr:hypothetical protein [Opitutaceae bacterium]
MSRQIHRLLFFWMTSLISAVAVYYTLRLFMPERHVFASLFRMHPYHEQHCIQYIAIPCFIYGIIAAALSGSFSKKGISGQALFASGIAAATILISSPLGGMSWAFHDMQAGFFPKSWPHKLAVGFFMGSNDGWMIILYSIPYNIIGLIVCYFLTKSGCALPGLPAANVQTGAGLQTR